jgi:ApaG protein
MTNPANSTTSNSYVEVSNNVKIEVEPSFVKEQSNPNEGYYFFAYRVHITNLSKKPLKLLSRHWIIRDGTGREEEVKGAGVVGEQPLLTPDKTYTYTSFCPLATPTGNMRGWYFLEDEKGNQVQAKIPVFFLKDPSRFN